MYSSVGYHVRKFVLSSLELIFGAWGPVSVEGEGDG
jgi:hypothetical protein